MGLLTISEVENNSFVIKNETNNKQITVSLEEDLIKCTGNFIDVEKAAEEYRKIKKVELLQEIKEQETLLENSNSSDYYYSVAPRRIEYLKECLDKIEFKPNSFNSRKFNLCSRFQLFDYIRESLFKNHPIDTNKFKKKFQQDIIRNKISIGSIKVHNSRIMDQLNKLYNKIPEDCKKLEKKIFSAVGPKNYESASSDIKYAIKHNIISKYLLEDMKKSVVPIIMYGNWQHSYDKPNSNFLKDNNWMAQFAPENKLYKNLTKTLMNIKSGGIPYRNMIALSRIKLEKPMNSLELKILLNFINQNRYGNNRRNQKCFLMATSDEIKRCAKLLSAHQRQKIDLRKKSSINTLCNFLIDYPEEHNGRIVGLMEKSIRWHRENYRTGFYRNVRDYLVDGNEVKSETLTFTPPIELPKEKEVIFLKTVGEIEEEGSKMNHCVANYAKKAVAGGCYIFHIEYEKEWATAELNEQGNIQQCYGPQNSKNNATKYAEKILKKWGSKLMKHLSKNKDDRIKPKITNKQTNQTHQLPRHQYIQEDAQLPF